MCEKAKYLIKLQAPHESNPILKKSKSKSSSSSELLQSWRQLQKDRSGAKTVSAQRRASMQEFARETVTILQMTSFDVSRIVSKVESVTKRGHKRAAGLALMTKVFGLAMSNMSRPIFIDSLNWLCAALRFEDPNQVVHYLDSLKGCGHRLERSMSTSFFQILQHIVKQLSLAQNTEKEVQLFLSALRWRFSGRDHYALSQLNLFGTLHESALLQKHWGKEVQIDFDKEDKRTPVLKFTVNLQNPEVMQDLKDKFDKHDSNKIGKLNFQQCKDYYKELMEKYHPHKDFFDNDQFNRQFDGTTWNRVSVDNKASFASLLKDMPYRVKKSTIGSNIL